MSQDTLTNPSPRGYKTPNKQGRIHRDPSKAKRIYPLERIPQGEAILIELDRHRFLTNSQVGQLLFRHTLTKFGKPRSEKQYQETCNEVLGHLFNAGYLERIQVYHTHQLTGNVFQDGVNLLTGKGAKAVQAAYDRHDSGETVRWTPDLKRFGFQKVDHELEINDFWIALQRGVWSLAPAEYFLHDRHDDDLLERAKATTRFNTFTPDGWCVVESPEGRLCPLFLEVDRGNEVVVSQVGSTKDWKTKIERYGEYFQLRYRDDPFYRQLEFHPDEMANPVVLIVTSSPERLRNMLAATEKAGGMGTYWYTTKAELYGAWGAILRPIWRRMDREEPVSLLDHIKGLPQ